MMGIILKILAVIGILLLVLLGLVLAAVLSVLFVPLTYRASGSMDGESRELKAKVRWLAGLLRADYRYPEPGRLVVKLLWKTLYDSGQDEKGGGDDGGRKDRRRKKEEGRKGKGKKDDGQTAGAPGEVQAHSVTAGAPEGAQGGSKGGGKSETAGTGAAPSGSMRQGSVSLESTGAGTPEAGAAGSGSAEAVTPETAAPSEGTGTGNPDSDGSGASVLQKLLDRMKKIWYTIRDKYDKIKKIWENISYYTELLREENTLALWGHVKKRLWKILKSIRPKHIRADILFGADSPDATGYAFGVYGMLSPYLGTKVCLTPDFTQAVLKGTFAVSGRITVFVILWNALTVAFDKKLHLFIKRMKAGRKKDG